MINAAIIIEKENETIEIERVLPQIPPVQTVLLIDDEEHEISDLFTVTEVIYDTKNYSMSVYVVPYLIV